MTPMIIPAITAADRLAEVGATEVGVAEVGVAEVGVAEVGVAEVGVSAVLVVVTTGTNGWTLAMVIPILE